MFNLFYVYTKLIVVAKEKDQKKNQSIKIGFKETKDHMN